MELLGIDIGGSGIKGAIVDTEKGKFTTERYRIDTPQPAIPETVTDTVAEIVRHFNWKGALGCTFPAIMKDGIAHSAANVDDSFIGVDVQSLIQRKTENPTIVMNDADAAGIAEMHFGAGRGKLGTTIILTLGTGIGSAIFRQGILVPNTELGHVYLSNGKEGEGYAADRIRSEQQLSWKKWGKRVNRYMQHIDFIFSPALIIIGGGVSKQHEKYFEYIKVNATLVPAQLRNQAGIIGAAAAALALA
ncbi:MAG: ROK family protein [Anaerolineae bacterium]|nr:ROK family protein [Anaerolineae bacterium]